MLSAFHRLTKLIRKAPLQAILIVPFVLQILVVVGLTGYLSYLNGQDAVKDLVSQLEQQVGDRVSQKLETYLRAPQLVNQINSDAVRQGLLNPENMPALEEYLWNQFQQFKDQPQDQQPVAQSALNQSKCSDLSNNLTNSLTFISIGTEKGNYTDLGYDPNGDLETTIRDRSRDDITRLWKLNSWGKHSQLTGTLPYYDPRVRPWYKDAVQAGIPVWITPYLTVSHNDMIISADRPLYDRQGNLVGVADATLSLSGISKFLCSLEVGQTGQVFIVEPNGKDRNQAPSESGKTEPFLIATSTGDQLFQGNGKNKRRLSVVNSNQPLTRATADYLQKTFGNFDNIVRGGKPQELNFFLDGDRQFIKVFPFPGKASADYRGLNWLVVVVIPQADFMAAIHENTRNTVLLCLAALLLAVAFGIAASRWITKPIQQLSQAAEALAEGDWDRQVSIQRSGELGSLAHAFNHMRGQLKRSRQQLEEYSRGLEQKNEQLETLEAELRRKLNLFLHAVSHDLRNPVIGASLVLKNLSEQPGDDLKFPRKVLERMIEGNQRQLDLINSLIDSHAAEIWGIALHSSPVSLSQVVEGAIADMQPILDREQATLINSIPTDLPQINGDPLQLGRVYQNLIANALKHNPRGLTLTLDAYVEEKWLRCTVTDDGIGISPEQCERLFDPYFRGNPKSKSVGLGLGLYLCRQIIQAHGGVIGVQSQPGKGTTFWFTLPIS